MGDADRLTRLESIVTALEAENAVMRAENARNNALNSAEREASDFANSLAHEASFCGFEGANKVLYQQAATSAGYCRKAEILVALLAPGPEPPETASAADKVAYKAAVKTFDTVTATLACSRRASSLWVAAMRVASACGAPPHMWQKCAVHYYGRVASKIGAWDHAKYGDDKVAFHEPISKYEEATNAWAKTQPWFKEEFVRKRRHEGGQGGRNGGRGGGRPAPAGGRGGGRNGAAPAAANQN